MHTEEGHGRIDVTFNFETDARGGDPDRSSATLRRYHQILWSKPLPDGTRFELDAKTPGAYLHHVSHLGEFFMSSDSIVHSYRNAYRKRIGTLMAEVQAEHVSELHDEGSTIGGYIIFPGNVRDGKPTINGARGMNAKICDRIDLTLECIRRHYLGEDSPLSGTLDRYKDFFQLFRDFRSYVKFFLLEDLVETDTDEINWYLPFDDFDRSPLPENVAEYDAYRRACLRFVGRRNKRVVEWTQANLV